MSAFDYAELFRHRGHKIVCVSYGQYNDPDNVAVECETCSEVLLDFDRPAYPGKHHTGAIREKKVKILAKKKLTNHRIDCLAIEVWDEIDAAHESEKHQISDPYDCDICLIRYPRRLIKKARSMEWRD